MLGSRSPDAWVLMFSCVTFHRALEMKLAVDSYVDKDVPTRSMPAGVGAYVLMSRALIALSWIFGIGRFESALRLAWRVGPFQERVPRRAR